MGDIVIAVDGVTLKKDMKVPPPPRTAPLTSPRLCTPPAASLRQPSAVFPPFPLKVGAALRAKEEQATAPVTSYKLTVVRKQEEEGEGGGEGGVGAGRDGDEETAGWLMWVRAREGRAVERPRRVWAVLKAGILTLYEDHDRRREVEDGRRPLQEALISLPGARPARGRRTLGASWPARSRRAMERTQHHRSRF